jgi:phospholipase/carboxylesterase
MKDTTGEVMFRPHKQLSGPVQNPRSNRQAEQLFFIFHGWGADGGNLLDIGVSFSYAFPDAEIHLPNGIEPCSANPNGHQWFNLESWDKKALTPGVEKAAILVTEYIRETSEHAGIDAKNIVLIGFSQGAMLAIHLGLTQPNLCNSVVAFSGHLIQFPDQVIADPPRCILIHGEEDDVVPVELMKESHKVLKEKGITVEGYCMDNLGHSISQEGLDLATQFLQKNLNK